MQKMGGVATPVLTPITVSARLAIWNRRLLITAAVLILWGASILALHTVGPHTSAMVAGEGTSIAIPD